MTPHQTKTLKAGDTLIYSDGRPGHCGVRGEVLSVTQWAMLVQFQDRVDTTKIRYDDPEWLEHLTVEISQRAFFSLPEVVAQVNIQKANPYGSTAHKAAWLAICAIAHLRGVSEHFHPSDY